MKHRAFFVFLQRGSNGKFPADVGRPDFGRHLQTFYLVLVALREESKVELTKSCATSGPQSRVAGQTYEKLCAATVAPGMSHSQLHERHDPT